jgi:hypothetical protein
MARATDRPEVDADAKRPGRPGITPEISSLILWRARENRGGLHAHPGALKNLGHGVRWKRGRPVMLVYNSSVQEVGG